ncbi:MAG TPA: YceI family protein [Candidatus Dormibacteraeota bacterium]|nr:YceI family protein [Candidatus Dormibacteraeota bacterium]
MRRSILAAVVLSVLVALAGGAYLYFFSGLRTTPKPLSMATPTPASSGSANATVVGDTSLVGRWKVGTGSQVGYRVREQFVGQTSPHEAVARTSSVSGGLTVQPGADGLEATGIALTADLTGLHSVDQVAGFNVSQRDFVVSRTLSVSQYPTATFRADQIPLPSNLAGGSTVTLTIPGELTIHGVARNITVTSQVRVNGDRAEATGSATIDMRDFGISPPQVPITTVQPQVTVEFQLELVRS